MRIVLLDDVFRAEHDAELIVAVWLTVQGRHRAIVFDERGSGYLAWLVRLNLAGLSDLWTNARNWSVKEEAVRPARHELTVTSQALAAKPSEQRLPIVDALTVLLKPYVLLLENASSDRAFVRAMVSPAERKALDQREAKGWFVYVGAGGVTELAKMVNAMRRDWKRTMLASAIFDSDALAPGRPSSQSQAVVKACGDLPDALHHHQLGRRAIENYLPLAALAVWPDGKADERVLKEFKKLTPAQRAHFNMKFGFNGDASNADQAGAASLYDRLSPQTRSTLSTGFGRDIAGLFDACIDKNGDWTIDEADSAMTDLRTFVAELLARSR